MERSKAFLQTLRLIGLANRLSKNDQDDFYERLWQNRLPSIPSSIRSASDLRDFLQLVRGLEVPVIEQAQDELARRWEDLWGEFFIPKFPNISLSASSSTVSASAEDDSYECFDDIRREEEVRSLRSEVESLKVSWATLQSDVDKMKMQPTENQKPPQQTRLRRPLAQL